MSTPFELNIALPADTRFAVTARDLVLQAGKQAGLDDASTRVFAEQVEAAVRASLDAQMNGATLPFAVRVTAGLVEVLLNGRTLRPVPS